MGTKSLCAGKGALSRCGINVDGLSWDSIRRNKPWEIGEPTVHDGRHGPRVESQPTTEQPQRTRERNVEFGDVVGSVVYAGELHDARSQLQVHDLITFCPGDDT